MKNNLFIALLFLLAIVIVGCEKNTVSSAKGRKENLPGEATGKSLPASLHDGVSISCAGTCNCGLVGSGKNVSCSCSECKMKLRFVSNGVIVREVELDDDAVYEVPMLEHYLAYAEDHLSNSMIKSIDITTRDNLEIILFTYESGGVEGSVMYSNSLTADEKYEIDCTGSCGCKEEYNFGTNKAACSCADCKMTVTKLSS